MRRKRTAVFLLIISILGLLVWLGVQWARIVDKEGKNTTLGLVIACDESFLEGKTSKRTAENPGICYEQMLLPYDADTNRLYLSQNSEDSEWVGNLSASDGQYTIYAKEDHYWEQKQSAIQENHIFTLWMVGETDYYEVDLVITGLPTLCMEVEYVTDPVKVEYEEDPDTWAFEREPANHGSMQLFNPGVGTDSYEIIETGVSFKIKGASTKAFEKKGYSLDITDNKGENIDVSLLGMRADNNWKLNALYTDKSRIREKTAAQIWEAFDEAAQGINEAGPRMEYVEVVIDNDYKGLYCLVEPVDAKKLELDKNDVLYKILDWTPPLLEDVMISAQNGWKVASSIRIRYPKVITDYNMAWHPICNYLERFYYAPELDLEGALSTVSVENYADMLLFTMATGASDNSFKNTYYAAKMAGDGSYVMYQIPWDLDYTFGNQYNYNLHNKAEFNADYTVVYEEAALPKVMQFEASGVAEYVLEKWQTYRESFLSTDAVIQLMTENRDYLIQTGVVIRESERWPESGVDTDIEELISYQEKRMTWLDEYFKEKVQ